jgi:hypothetical protein
VVVEGGCGEANGLRYRLMGDAIAGTTGGAHPLRRL